MGSLVQIEQAPVHAAQRGPDLVVVDQLPGDLEERLAGLVGGDEAVGKRLGQRREGNRVLEQVGLIAVVRMAQGARRFALVRWGLIPGFVEDPKKFSLLINVRSEGIRDKGTTKNAMKYRRCLVPASGFYEWRTMPGSNSGRTRQPFWLRPRDGKPIALAGLWETWSDRVSGGEIDSAAIVTTGANATVKPITSACP